jgi:hypothetical protein
MEESVESITWSMCLLVIGVLGVSEDGSYVYFVAKGVSDDGSYVYFVAKA